MTTIAGMIRQNQVYIAGDTQSSDGYHKLARQDTKVFEKQGIAFGFTTSYRMGQILKYHTKIPPYPFKEPAPLYEWMVTQFIPSFIHSLEEHKWIEKEKDRVRGGQILVGIGPKLFQIDNDFQVIEPNLTYYAIGSGCSFALGVLDTLIDQSPYPLDSVVEILTISIRVASHHDLNTNSSCVFAVSSLLS